MANHYFVGIVLPELRLGKAPELSFAEFSLLLEDNLSPFELRQVRVLRTFYDLENIRATWKNEPLHSYGYLDENALEEALLQAERLPIYVQNFLETYKTTEERLCFFPKLIAAYYREEAAQNTGFLKEFLEFERKWRFIQADFRARELGRDLALELQFENPEEPFIRQLLAQKNSEIFEPPEGFEVLKELFEKHYKSPIELYKAMSHYRFQKLGELRGGEEFGLDTILAYQLQLMIVEQTRNIYHSGVN